MARNAASRAHIDKRRNDAIQLRIAGAEWKKIAEQLGYASAQAAHRDVVRAMEANARELRETIEVYRELMMARLDKVSVALWPKVMTGDTSAATAYLRVVEQSLRITGVPVRHEVLTLDYVDAQIERLEREQRERAGRSAAGEAAPAAGAARPAVRG